VKLVFHEKAWEDYLYWHSSDGKPLDGINTLIKETSRMPFTGTGKPEPLRGPLSGWWSRRITQEHRLVYRAEEDRLLIAQCCFHC